MIQRSLIFYLDVFFLQPSDPKSLKLVKAATNKFDISWNTEKEAYNYLIRHYSKDNNLLLEDKVYFTR